MKSDPEYIELLQKRVSGSRKESASPSIYRSFTVANKDGIYVSV